MWHKACYYSFTLKQRSKIYLWQKLENLIGPIFDLKICIMLDTMYHENIFYCFIFLSRCRLPNWTIQRKLWSIHALHYGETQSNPCILLIWWVIFLIQTMVVEIASTLACSQSLLDFAWFTVIGMFNFHLHTMGGSKNFE